MNDLQTSETPSVPAPSSGEAAPVNMGNPQDPDKIKTPETIPIPPPIEPASKTPDDPDFAKRFTALTRKEREIQSQAEKNKADLQALSEFKKNQELLKTNPLKFMEASGIKLQDLVDLTLNDGKETPNLLIQQLNEKVSNLEKERQEERERSQKGEYDKNIAEYKSKQRSHLEGKKDNYELINHYEAFDTVYDIMNKHFIETGEELDIDKVAAHVEDYYEKQLEKVALTKKFQSRYAKPVTDTTGTPTKETEKKSPTSITNAEFSGSVSDSKTNEYLDDEASKRKAAKVLQSYWDKAN
jgi:hypothetical protein